MSAVITGTFRDLYAPDEFTQLPLRQREEVISPRQPWVADRTWANYGDTLTRIMVRGRGVNVYKPCLQPPDRRSHDPPELH